MNNTNWNNKEQVLVAVSKNGQYLKYASEKLKNDLELLSLLHQFYNLPENKIEYVNIKKWLAERMKTRDILWNKI